MSVPSPFLWFSMSDDAQRDWQYVEAVFDEAAVGFKLTPTHTRPETSSVRWFTFGIDCGFAVRATLDYDADGDSEGWHDLSRCASIEILPLAEHDRPCPPGPQVTIHKA